MPSPIWPALARIADPKTTSARPTPRCVDHDPTGLGSRDPVEQRLAEGGGWIGVIVELAGVPVGQELVALVDEEQRRIARDFSGAVRRVVDRHDEGVGREPVVGHDLADRAERRGGDHDVRVVRCRACVCGHRDLGDAVRRSRRLGEATSGIRRLIEDRERTSRKDVPDHFDVAVTLDARADDRDAGRTLARRRRHWRIATPDTAAVRWAVIGPPSMIAVGTPVAASFRTTVALMAGSPSARFAPKPGTHLMPRRSSPPSASCPRRCAGIAWANEPSGRGCTAIFGGRSASATRATRVVAGERETLLDRRHRGFDIGRGQIGQRRDRGLRHRRESTRRRCPTMRRCPPSTSSRASTTSSWNATRSCSTTPSPASRRTRGAPMRSAASRATNGATPTSGHAS